MFRLSDDIDGYTSYHEKPSFYVPRLSRGAKDLWAYIMHRPEEWKISIDFLYKFYDPEISCRLNGEKKHIEKSLDELVRYDFIKSDRICE
jgi:hypothetical protein